MLTFTAKLDPDSPRKAIAQEALESAFAGFKGATVNIVVADDWAKPNVWESSEDGELLVTSSTIDLDSGWYDVLDGEAIDVLEQCLKIYRAAWKTIPFRK